MASSRYYTEKYDGRTVHIIRTKPWNIEMKLIEKSIWDSLYDYGINATFFGVRLSQIVGICINGNTPVGYGNSENGAHNGSGGGNQKRGTLVYYGDDGFLVRTVRYYTELPDYRNIVWAVGGGELFLRENLTSSADLKRKLEDSPRSWNWEETLDGDICRGRSGIGYDRNSNVYLFGLPDGRGATMWEFREIAKQIGCFEAIFLDGGQSSQLKWSDGSESYGFGSLDRRSVPTIVKLKSL